MADYEAGVSAAELGRRYRLAKGTVRKLLHEYGTATPTRPSTPITINQARKSR